MNVDTIWVFAIALWGAFIILFARDRSRYRNCAVLFMALLVTIEAMLVSAGPTAHKVALVIIFIVLIMVPEFLIWNGIVMIKRESATTANILSLLLGLVIFIGEVATLVLVFRQITPSGMEPFKNLQPLHLLIMLAISVSVMYASLSFLMFMIYSVFLMLIPRKRDFDYVIIHGAGLIDGERVTKLLADRLDKAIEIYRKDPTPPFMIPSGGQGGDEKISEAEAMKNYLVENGIPEEHILLEDKSKTTYENLFNSKEIIQAREGRKYTALVTSNYHVYRALRYCRKIGLECTGVGSHVAFYYWPSALIREYIAVHAEKKHALMFLIGWVMIILPVMISIGAYL